MKKINYVLLLLISAMFVYSCGKKGSQGPQGNQGPIGPIGFTGGTGAVGATGANGTKIYSGVDTPTVAIGDTGDFYIDLSTSALYGPKTTTGWGSSFSLIGATGATGAAGTNGTNGATGQTGATGTPGSVIYSGITVPDSTIGINGDYYLNTVTELFYGPKTANQWPAPVSIMGKPGTANVIYSDWITPNPYVTTTSFGRTIFTATIAEPKINQAILDQGAVIVYGKLDAYNAKIWPVDQVSQLPILVNYVQSGKSETDTWSGNYTIGNIKIAFSNNHNLYTTIDSLQQQFRYIIIPGGVSAAAAYKGKSYQQVQQMLHLKN